MIINKVLNNNFVIVKDENGTEKIIGGKGIAYGKKPGQIIDSDCVNKVFVVPSSNNNPVALKYIEALPVEYLGIAIEIVEFAKDKTEKKLSESVCLGIAIDPTDGIVYAPFDATVAMLFPTKHAIGLISDGGCELLIHIGMNTVELEGQYFESFVEQGDRVKRGDKLIIFDIDKIKAAGYSVITPVVVTNSKDYIEVDAIAESEVNAENEIIIVRV